MNSLPQTSTMTKAERTDLCTLIRRRERIEKTATAERAAELRADFEQQLAMIYSFDNDKTWKAAKEAADAAVQAAQTVIEARCKELGIPKQFAPGVAMGWYGRGENATASRRAELRHVATSRIDAMEKAARTTIEKRSVELQEQVIVTGISSDAAVSFLAKLPSVQSLMPSIDARSLFKERNLIEQDDSVHQT